MRTLSLIFGLFFSIPTMGQKGLLMDLNGLWKFTIGDREEFADPNYDDRNWERIKVPSAWEDQGFANYNGYAWYRYTFDGEDLEGLKNLELHLGFIDDVNETYFNGKLIGFKGSFPPNYYTAYDAEIRYIIPEELVNRTGKNTIAIKVYDSHIAGGIVKGKVGIYFEAKFPEEFFSLEGIWKFTTKRKSGWENPYYIDSNWDNIVVPSFWRSKHIRWFGSFTSNRIGWYRKEFRLPEYLKDEDLYLVMGVIDDFDYTYLNGQIIGRTKDNLPFGESTSWSQYRIYKIPEGVINKSGRNVIAVQVEDIGIDAGIYKGPVGIVRQKDLSRTIRRN